MASHVSSESCTRPGIISTAVVPNMWALRTQIRLYTTMAGETTACIAAKDAVDSLHKGLVSFGRRHRSWGNASYTFIFGGPLGLVCPPRMFREILSIEITNPSVYRARRDDRRNCCKHHSNKGSTQPRYPVIVVIARGGALHYVIFQMYFWLDVPPNNVSRDPE